MRTTSAEARIETSTVCDFSCLMCPRESLTRRREVMDDELFDAIARTIKREMPGVRALTISGFGEFAADPGWRHKVREASTLFETLHLLTNLSLLELPDLRLILQYATDIRISLCALTDDAYALVHRPPRPIPVAELERKIAFLMDERGPRQRILLNYVELPENAGETRAWIERWEGNVDSIEVWKPHNWVGARGYRLPCPHRLPSCGRPFAGPLQVQVDGSVNVCCFDSDGVLVIGDLRRQSLSEIFDGEEMERIQSLHASGAADVLAPCSVCDQRDCVECKGAYLVYSSSGGGGERVVRSSTEGERML